MSLPSVTTPQDRLFEQVLAGLRSIGYKGDLLQKSYQFEDWFTVGDQPRVADAAAFGRSLHSYESACFAVARSNGVSGTDLVSNYRALGAPLAFEVQQERVLLWRVEADASVSNSPMVLTERELGQAFRVHEENWKPANLLRAKNIGPVGPVQKDFIDFGLVPALEQHILEKLDPLLRSIFFEALKFYQRRRRTVGRPDWLFRLVFRALAGKVMADRQFPGFEEFVTSPKPDELLAAVNAHFGDATNFNADADTRRLVVERLWRAFNFKNISVPILSFVWENTLVDDSIREELAIHGTPPVVARYMVKHLGIESIPEGKWIVEPCCGGGAFLLAARQRLADFMDPDSSDKDRHEYLRQRLAGFDVDPFGLEVARDCLMLADYPNSNHWILRDQDVFAGPDKSPEYHDRLKNAAVVLCNPPFGKFTVEARKEYGATSIHRPVELLNRVLDAIPQDSTLGFVLPHLVLTGQSYPGLRRRRAERFRLIEIVTLPGQGVFASAEYETALLIAREPRSGGESTNVVHSKVDKRDWASFCKSGEPSQEDSQRKRVSDAQDSLAVPNLQSIWHYLRDHETVETATGGIVHRGIEWNITVRKNRHILLSDEPKEGYRLGIPPSKKTQLHSFQRPALKYLCFLPEYRRWGAFELPWDRPKVLMNGRRKGRYPWRLAAFADDTGLGCYHTFLGLWPTADWSPVVLSAVLNGPLASAFITTHTIGRDVPSGMVKKIPVPRLSPELARRIEKLVHEYVEMSQDELPLFRQGRSAERILLEIDAAVLQGYELPPRLERRLLDYFNGQGDRRPVPFYFSDYFPARFRPYFSLSDYLAEGFHLATAKEFRQRREPVPASVLDTLRALTKKKEE